MYRLASCFLLEEDLVENCWTLMESLVLQVENDLLIGFVLSLHRHLVVVHQAEVEEA